MRRVRKTGPGLRRKIPEGPTTAPLFVLTRTHFPRLTVVSGFSRTLLCASIVWPSHAYAQAKDAFVEGLTQLINAVDGTFGDEGPALQSAVEAMTRGLAQWDERVARVESGFRADVAEATPPAAARMRARSARCISSAGEQSPALEQFDAAASLDPSLSQVHVFRAMALDRLSRSGVAAAYRAAWESKRDEKVHGVSRADGRSEDERRAQRAMERGRSPRRIHERVTGQLPSRRTARRCVRVRSAFCADGLRVCVQGDSCG